MDPNLACIDPSLLQLGQIFEDEEEVPILESVSSSVVVSGTSLTFPPTTIPIQDLSNVTPCSTTSSVASATTEDLLKTTSVKSCEGKIVNLLKRKHLAQTVDETAPPAKLTYFVPTPLTSGATSSSHSSHVEVSLAADDSTRSRGASKPAEMVADSLSEATSKIVQHERQYGVHFRIRKAPKDFGQSGKIFSHPF